jgi:hypothetical protein
MGYREPPQTQLLPGSNSTDDSKAHSPDYIAAGVSPPGGVIRELLYQRITLEPKDDEASSPIGAEQEDLPDRARRHAGGAPGARRDQPDQGEA